MIVLVYYGVDTFVLRYEVLSSAPSPLPANTIAINMADVPDGFFESYDAYKVTAGTLVVNGLSLSKRIPRTGEYTESLLAKVAAVPWAVERICKTSSFHNL